MFTFHCRSAGAALVLALTLAGCTSGGSNWTKAGVSDAQRSDDFSDCRDQARQETQRNYAIDQDIQASQAGINGLGTYNNAYSSQTSQIATANAAKNDQILAACMAGKGYNPAS
jgi:hypothetical protein